MIGDPTELLIFLDQATAKLHRKSKEGGWRLRDGVEIFIAPESRCSFCNETFETNRVYVLDSVNKAVPKQWRLADGQAVRRGNKMYHPHAFHTNGGICMNHATTLPQLIFNSINTGVNYYAPQYYWDVGHDCPKFPKKSCPFCNKRVPGFVLKHDYADRRFCSVDCVGKAAETRCYRCYNEHGGGKYFGSKGPLCPTCYDMYDAVPVAVEDPDDDDE